MKKTVLLYWSFIIATTPIVAHATFINEIEEACNSYVSRIDIIADKFTESDVKTYPKMIDTDSHDPRQSYYNDLCLHYKYVKDELKKPIRDNSLYKRQARMELCESNGFPIDIHSFEQKTKGVCNKFWSDYTIPLKILAANLYAGNSNSFNVSKKLISLDADIIILLEWNGQNIERELFSQYDFVVDYPLLNASGIAIAVKKWHQATGTLIPPPLNNNCSMPFGTTTLTIKRKPISIIGVHMPAPIKNCNGTTQPMIEATSEWLTNGMLNRDVGTGKRGDIAIIAGDFNSFSFSRGIERLIEKGFVDAVEKSNHYFNGTWAPSLSSNIPKIARIDYIFSSKHIKLIRSENITIEGSDHDGVLATYEIH